MKNLKVKALIAVFVLCLSGFAGANSTCEGSFEPDAEAQKQTQANFIEPSKNIIQNSESKLSDLYSATANGDLHKLITLFQNNTYSKHELRVARNMAIENNQAETVELLNLMLSDKSRERMERTVKWLVLPTLVFAGAMAGLQILIDVMLINNN